MTPPQRLVRPALDGAEDLLRTRLPAHPATRTPRQLADLRRGAANALRPLWREVASFERDPSHSGRVTTRGG